jgi:hypothetical protein
MQSFNYARECFYNIRFFKIIFIITSRYIITSIRSMFVHFFLS